MAFEDEMADLVDRQVGELLELTAQLNAASERLHEAQTRIASARQRHRREVERLSGALRVRPSPNTSTNGVPPPLVGLSRSPLRNQIVTFLAPKTGKQATTEMMVKELGVDRKKLIWTLSHMKKAGILKHPRRGSWKLVEVRIDPESSGPTMESDRKENPQEDINF
jgi:predicted transcriptional regulator